MTISSDGINHFIGSLYTNNSTLAIARTELSTFLTNALGAGRFAISTNTTGLVFNWRPNIPQETKTSTIVSSNAAMLNSYTAGSSADPSAGGRFAQACLYVSTTDQFLNSSFAINSNTSTGLNAIYNSKPTTFATNTEGTSICYITANNRSVASFVWNRTTGHWLFVWTGVMLPPPNQNLTTYPTNCCAIAVGRDSSGNTFATASRVAFANSTTAMQILTSGKANYAIACADAQTSGYEGTVSFPTSGLLSYWALDESSGNRLDKSGNTNTLVPSAALGSSVGKLGNAAKFDTTAKLSTPGTFFDVSKDFTVSFWIKFNDVSGRKLLFTKFNSSTISGFAPDINASQFRVFLRLDSTTYLALSHTQTITTGVYYFVVCTHNASTKDLRLFVNNVDSSTIEGSSNNPYSFTMTNPTANVVIGGRDADSLDIPNADIDEVGVWNKVLTRSEITYLYNRGNGITYVPPASTTPTFPTSGVLSYWALDETSGDRLDKSGNNITLTPSAALASSVGKLGNAAKFDTTAKLSNAGTFFDVSKDFTVTFWVKSNASNSGSTFFGKALSSSNGIYLDINSASNYVLVFGNGTNILNITDARTIATGTYYFIAITHNAATKNLRLSVNNVENFTASAANNPYSFTMANPTATVAVGGYSPNTSHIPNADIDEVGIWNRVLTSSEITYLYNGGTGVTYGGATSTTPTFPTSGVLSYWALDETSGDRLDKSGNNITLTPSAALASSVGKLGNAAKFDTTAKLSNAGSFFDVSKDFTVTFWIKFNVIDYRILVSKYSSSVSIGLSIEINSSKYRVILRNDSSTLTVTDAQTVATGTYYFVVVTHNAATKNLRLSVNTVENFTSSIANNPYSFTMSNPTATVVVGGLDSSTSYIPNADIDEVGIWNRVLTSSEISSLYNGGTGITYVAPTATFPSSGVLSYWALDETSGDRLDKSGNSNTLVPSAALASSVGKLGNAAKFDTTAKLTAPGTFFKIASDFTVALWVKFNVSENKLLFIQYQPSPTVGFYIDLNNSKYRAVFLHGSSNMTLTDAQTIATGTYYFIAVTHNATTKNLRLSVNNVENFTTSAANNPYSFTLFNSTVNVVVGGRDDSNVSIPNADIDEVGIWNRVLTSSEITYLYNSGAGVTYGGATSTTPTPTPTPTNWTTDLYLRDNDIANGDPATGRCSNLVLARGTGFEIGKFYKLKTSHVDGGSSNFICVADWGTDKIMMRTTS